MARKYLSLVLLLSCLCFQLLSVTLKLITTAGPSNNMFMTSKRGTQTTTLSRHLLTQPHHILVATGCSWMNLPFYFDLASPGLVDLAHMSRLPLHWPVLGGPKALAGRRHDFSFSFPSMMSLPLSACFVFLREPSPLPLLFLDISFPTTGGIFLLGGAASFEPRAPNVSTLF